MAIAILEHINNLIVHYKLFNNPISNLKEGSVKIDPSFTPFLFLVEYVFGGEEITFLG